MLKPLEISQQQLRSLLNYDPESGTFRWHDGRVAGSPRDARGYIRIGVGPKRFYAQRLAFIYMTGACPAYIDHIDGDKANNGWANLRAATKAQNGMNRGANKNNTSGFKGVYYQANGYIAEVHVDGKKHYLGRFHTAAEAGVAAANARRVLHGEFARS